MITCTIAGQLAPLIQLTIRRDANGGEMDLQLAGNVPASLGQPCTLNAGEIEFTGTIIAHDPGPRSTRIMANLAVLMGNEIFAPAHILAQSESRIRTPLAFALLPGDSWRGLILREITHTMGVASPWFTEARYG